MQDVDRLLDRLVALDGAEEAAVVREAIAAGVPLVVVLDELEREVERRERRRALPRDY
jgi:ribosomal protein S2